MNLVLFNRAELSKVPGLIGELDQLWERINTVWGKQHHPQTGAHTDITADSVTADSITAVAFGLNETTQTTVGAAGGALGVLGLLPCPLMLSAAGLAGERPAPAVEAPPQRHGSASGHGWSAGSLGARQVG